MSAFIDWVLCSVIIQKYDDTLKTAYFLLVTNINSKYTVATYLLIAYHFLT